jgi:hypothetical protein
VNAATAAFAALVIYLGAALIALRSGARAVRRGPPEPETEPQSLPQASSGGFITALGVACFLFGFSFGAFLIYFGAALAVLGMARLGVEVRAERAARRRIIGERRP